MAFPKASNYIFASLLTGIFDVNRNELLNINDFGIIKKWYDSILQLQLNAIIFHNTFSKETIQEYSTENIQFINVEYDGKLNPNVYRYLVYQQFLKQNKLKINNLFITDITDVEVVQNPFESKLFLQMVDSLFCGDEPEILDNLWMKNHCEHLRKSIPDFNIFEEKNKKKKLLNCGIIGGNIVVITKLLDKMVALHQQYSYNNTTAYTLDMGVFNYIARTIFSNKILHGEPINTIFKQYENKNLNCWFRHK